MRVAKPDCSGLTPKELALAAYDERDYYPFAYAAQAQAKEEEDMKTLFLFSMVAIAAMAAPALAAQRTFVSTLGTGAACSLVTPCRQLSTALLVTDPNGEVIVLDSGGYGKATITQSVSIIAPPGVYAGISVFGGDDGVTIAAGGSAKIVLNGLTINGQGGNRGIVVTTAGKVSIENCVISGVGSNGIEVNSANTSVYVRNTMVRGNGDNGLRHSGLGEAHVSDSTFSGNAGSGILVEAGNLTATRISGDDNGERGLLAQPSAAGTTRVTLADSMVAGNVNAGVFAFTTIAGSTVEMNVARSTSARNGGGGYSANSNDVGTILFALSESSSFDNGLNGFNVAGTSAVGVVSNSMLASNTQPDLNQTASGVLRTSGNNALTGRGAADVGGALTANPLK